MKTSNAGIDAVLAGTSRFAADLFTFYFASGDGGTVRWTAADTDLSYGGNTWLASGPIMLGGRGRSTAGLEVDTASIVMAPGTRTIGSQTIKIAALKGAFDKVRVLIQRAYMSTWGTVPGLITTFDGLVQGDPEIGSTEIRVTVKSKLSRLSTEVPRRTIQPQCPFLVYDANCGLTEATFSSSGLTVAAGSTAKVVKLSATSAFATVGGYVLVSGLRRTVQSVSGVDLTLSVALPGVPTTGGSIVVSKGCDKTRNTGCRSFGTAPAGNIARFGGSPDMPKNTAVAPQVPT